MLLQSGKGEVLTLEVAHQDRPKYGFGLNENDIKFPQKLPGRACAIEGLKGHGSAF